MTRGDYQLRAAIWDNKPAVTYARFKFIPSRRQQDYWLCLNAYNRHAWALKEMGRRHWQGENVPRQDKVLGFMWYSLVAKTDPAHVDKQKERRRSLTPAQLRKAEQLAAKWLRKLKRLRSSHTVDSACDDLPGW